MKTNWDIFFTNSIGKKIARSMKRISGGKNISLVVIRRSFATHIRNLPDDERRKLSLKMGHSSTTNSNYSHEKKDEKKDEKNIAIDPFGLD